MSQGGGLMAGIRAIVLVTTALSAALLAADNGTKPVLDKPAISTKPILPQGTPAEQVATLIKQYNVIATVLQEKFEAAKTEAEQEKILESAPDRQDYAALLLKVAQQHPRNPAAVRALIWIVRNAPAPRAKEDAPFAIAQAILIREHLDDAQIGPFCLTLRHDCNDSEAVELIRRILDANPHKVAQAHAAFALSKLLRSRAEWAKHIQRADATQLANYEKSEGKGVVAELKQIDVESLMKQAEDLLERVTKDKEFAETVSERGQQSRRLGEVADAE